MSEFYESQAYLDGFDDAGNGYPDISSDPKLWAGWERSMKAYAKGYADRVTLRDRLKCHARVQR